MGECYGDLSSNARGRRQYRTIQLLSGYGSEGLFQPWRLADWPQLVHIDMVKFGIALNKYLENYLISMCAKCGDLDDALYVLKDDTPKCGVMEQHHRCSISPKVN